MRMIESIRMMGAEDFARQFMVGDCHSCPVASGCESKWTILECLGDLKYGKAKKSGRAPFDNCMKRCVEWLERDFMEQMRRERWGIE